MLKALLLKELRETARITLVALLAHLAFVGNCTGHTILPFCAKGNVWEIPFLDGQFLLFFCFVSVAFAIALGLGQTVTESRHGTWLFLLHRPVSLWKVLGVKLVVGGGLYLLCGLIAILSYAAWAAMPGKHASPFLWWMTAWAWEAWGVIAIVYLAAFLAGIRPARWFGTRLLPLVAGAVLAFLLAICFLFWPLLGVAALLLAAACLIGLIHFTARTRDFS